MTDKTVGRPAEVDIRDATKPWLAPSGSGV